METSSYVGFRLLPPLYPEIVETTPGSLSYGGSMHQKHPPANVAFASAGDPGGGGAVPCAAAAPGAASAAARARARAAGVKREIHPIVIPPVRFEWGERRATGRRRPS